MATGFTATFVGATATILTAFGSDPSAFSSFVWIASFFAKFQLLAMRFRLLRRYFLCGITLSNLYPWSVSGGKEDGEDGEEGRVGIVFVDRQQKRRNASESMSISAPKRYLRVGLLRQLGSRSSRERVTALVNDTQPHSRYCKHTQLLPRP